MCHVRFARRCEAARRDICGRHSNAVNSANAVTVHLRRATQLLDGQNPALWLTERGEQISLRQIDDLRAVANIYRAASELSVHCLRHSYISHLIEDSANPLFVQQQTKHS